MSKYLALTIEGGGYPFGMGEGQGRQVRRRLGKVQGELQRVKIVASLKHECLIKIQGVQEEGGQHWILYQYVPQSIQRWATSVSRQFIQNYEQRLILFSRYLADKCLLLTFRREHMGATLTGDPKYYIDTNFIVDPTTDRLSLKKRYKEEIRQLIQGFLDKKGAVKLQSPKVGGGNGGERKENSKVMKILQAIEKGRANLCSDKGKEVGLGKEGGMMPRAGQTNIFIQKEMNKVNKIQVMVGNRPVEVLQEQFKRQYASSSFYLNGVPTLKIERQGEARRLFSPTDKFTRFQEVKYKEYKIMKTSGEVYVQDFINVLEDDSEKLTLPGSPRTTMRPASPHNRLNTPTIPQKMITNPNPKLTILSQQPKESKCQRKNSQLIDRITSPRNSKGNTQNRLFGSEREIKIAQKVDSFPRAINNSSNHIAPPPPTTTTGSNSKASQLQKKVSQAIANSMNAISKFKNAAKGGQANP